MWGPAEKMTRVMYTFCERLAHDPLPATIEFSDGIIEFDRKAFVNFVKDQRHTEELNEMQLDRVLYDEWGLYYRLAKVYAGRSDWTEASYQFTAAISPDVCAMTKAAFGLDLLQAQFLGAIVVNGYVSRGYFLTVASADELMEALTTTRADRVRTLSTNGAHRALIGMDAENRASVIHGLRKQRRRHETNENERDKEARNLLICGTRQLTPTLVQLAAALGQEAMSNSRLILVTGGRRIQGMTTTDQAVAEAAAATLRARHIPPEERIVTMLPDISDADRDRVVIGRAQVLPDTYHDTRRMGMVYQSSAVIAIAGNKTGELLSVAWGARKPVLPLAFTGGASRDFWNRYRNSIIERLGLRTDDVRMIEQGGDTQEVARRCIAIISDALR